MPIIGDTAHDGLDLGCGLLLAAEYISFMHPVTLEQLEFSLGEPARFRQFWDAEARAFEAHGVRGDVNASRNMRAADCARGSEDGSVESDDDSLQ
jgi:hypothetical protein